MATISMILSGLALLAAITSLALTVRNEKRSQKRKTDLVNYVDAGCKAASGAAGIYTDGQAKKLTARIEKLEQGITPDYEQARVAADAVNSFNQGITNLLGYDPFDALQAKREKEAGGSE